LASTYNVTCDELHRHFVNIATDEDYVKSLITDQHVNNTAVNNSVAFCERSDEYIAKLLSKIKNTSPGYDGIPSWFYKSFSTEMSHVI